MICRPRLTFLKFFLSLVLFQLLSARAALAEELPSDDTALAERIYYGVSVPNKNSPTAELFVTFASGRTAYCSGVVLNRHTILTAAHCLYGEQVSEIIFRSGDIVGYGLVYDYHPAYAPKSTFSLSSYDLGYVKLDRNLPRSVKPVKLSKRYPAYGETVYVFGYGKDEYGNIGSLKGGVVTATTSDGIRISAIRPYNGSSTCEGDSGGPAFVLRKKKLYLVGVTSYGGIGCQTFSGFASAISPTAKSFIKLAKKKLKKR